MIFPLGLTVFETGHKKSEKRKKIKGGEAGEIDNFLGPWAKYLDEKDGSKPTEVNYVNSFSQQKVYFGSNEILEIACL